MEKFHNNGGADAPSCNPHVEAAPQGSGDNGRSDHDWWSALKKVRVPAAVVAGLVGAVALLASNQATNHATMQAARATVYAEWRQTQKECRKLHTRHRRGMCLRARRSDLHLTPQEAPIE